MTDYVGYFHVRGPRACGEVAVLLAVEMATEIEAGRKPRLQSRLAQMPDGSPVLPLTVFRCGHCRVPLSGSADLQLWRARP